MWPSISVAQGFGYGVAHVWPESIRVGAANRQPEPTEIEMRGSHAGTLRMRRAYGLLTCSVGIAEGGPGRIAEAAEPHLRTLGLEPLLDDREGALAVSVWRGAGRQAVISRSTEFRPGSELVITGSDPRGGD